MKNAAHVQTLTRKSRVLFIPCWFFFCLAALGPDCFAQAVSGCDEWKLLLQCTGLSLRGFCWCWAKTSGAVARGLHSCGAGLSCSAACGLFLDQDQCRVPCIGRWILMHCTTREVLALYFHLPFLLWIKTLHSTYCQYLNRVSYWL